MKRQSTIEIAFLALATIFIGFGAYSVVHPTEMFVSHPGSGRYQSIIGHDPAPEHVTKSGARIYGVLSLGFGVGIAWLVLYRPRKH
jgi:hypothetical protein